MTYEPESISITASKNYSGVGGHCTTPI